MKLNIKKVFKERTGSETLVVYILLLLLAVLTMGILLYLFGPAIKEIQIPMFQSVKKYLSVIMIILLIIIQFKKKIA